MNALLDPLAHPVIAHRGASGEAPENTLAAFRLAVEQGADAFEFDVRVTADGVPVVFHDATLDRTTDRRGAVAGLPLAVLREADAGARHSSDGGITHPWRGRGITIPTLEEVLQSFPDVPCIIELKTAAAVAPVRALLGRLSAAGRCVLMSFDAAAVAALRGDTMLTGATASDAAALLGSGLVGRTPHALPYGMLAVPERWYGMPIPMRMLARAAQRARRPLHVWVVDDPLHAVALWRAGVCGIITNVPRAVRTARDAHPGWRP